MKSTSVQVTLFAPGKIWQETPVGKLLEVAIVEKGTTTGDPAVAFRLSLPDGSLVCFDTTSKVVERIGEMAKSVREKTNPVVKPTVQGTGSVN